MKFLAKDDTEWRWHIIWGGSAELKVLVTKWGVTGGREARRTERSLFEGTLNKKTSGDLSQLSLINICFKSEQKFHPHPGCSDGWVGVCALRVNAPRLMKCHAGPCGGKAVPSSPPCLCGTSSLDPLHTVIRGRPLRASASWWRANSGNRGEWRSLGHQAGKQQHVSHSSRSGWDGWRANERQWVRQTLPVFFFLSLSTPCCSKRCTIVCLGRLLQEGPLSWCLCNLFGNFLGHLISQSLPPAWRFSHLSL